MLRTWCTRSDRNRPHEGKLPLPPASRRRCRHLETRGGLQTLQMTFLSHRWYRRCSCRSWSSSEMARDESDGLAMIQMQRIREGEAAPPPQAGKGYGESAGRGRRGASCRPSSCRSVDYRAKMKGAVSDCVIGQRVGEAGSFRQRTETERPNIEHHISGNWAAAVSREQKAE